MKKYMLFSLMLGVFHLLQAGSGTEISPFSVSEGIKHKQGENVRYWVKGYIVGELSQFSNNKYFYDMAPPFAGVSAYLLADSPTEIDLTKCIPVAISSRIDELNLEENPQYWRKEVQAYGFFRDYFSMPGLKDLTGWQILTPEPWKNETASWVFYEDFDEKKAYERRDAGKTFAGGIYSGYLCTWNFVGATMGEDADDQKWDRSSARIRLTEGPTGDSGYIEMMEDKANGIGTVRFWAGYYGTDNSSYLKFSVSSDQGKTWQQVVAPFFVEKKWKEYQFEINKSGNLRLRIGKGDTTPAGINVDKIRISDYTDASGLQEIGKDMKWSYSVSGNTIEMQLNEPENKISLFDSTGRIIFKATWKNGIHTMPIPDGISILQVNGQCYKIIGRPR